MREFIYFSPRGRTSGNFDDMMKAGRLDIAVNVIIAAFFLSEKRRRDVLFHLILNGPPDPPKHLEFDSREEIPFSKKDIDGLFKRMLFKYRQGQRAKVFDGCYVEKKSFQQVVRGAAEAGKTIYLLDERGQDIRNVELQENAVFILGDHEGLNKNDIKFAKRYAKCISVGPEMYFASQVVVLVHNELDRKGL